MSNNPIVELISDPKKGLILKNTVNKIISNENEAFNLIMEGNKNRTENATENNKNSSRSHAILNIYINIEDEEMESTQKKSFGKFSEHHADKSSSLIFISFSTLSML